VPCAIGLVDVPCLHDGSLSNQECATAVSTS
jgi:hypothetical protein